MTEKPQDLPTEEELDVEGPNESSQPSGAPGLEPDDSGSGGGNPSDPDDST